MGFAHEAKPNLCNDINCVKVMIIQAEIYNHRHIIGFITRRQALIFVVHTRLINMSAKFF